MQTAAACEFPHTLDHIELRTVRRQVFDHEILRVFLAPRAMEFGMMIAGIVQNEDDLSS